MHHQGGKLVGSVLLRRHPRDVRPPPQVVAASDVAAEQRLATLEARLSVALDRFARQEAETVAMRAELSRLEYVPTAMTNMHHRLDAVEAVCERGEEAEGRAAEEDQHEAAENGDDEGVDEWEDDEDTDDDE